MALEFALIALPLVTLLVGIAETSWQLMTAAVLDEAVLRASRFGITGQATRAGGPPQLTCRSQTIAWLITGSTGGFLKPNHLTISTEAYSGASGMSGGGAIAGPGIGGQIVTYSVTYDQPVLTGAWLGLAGVPDHITHRASIVVKNEPFDNATC